MDQQAGTLRLAGVETEQGPGAALQREPQPEPPAAADEVKAELETCRQLLERAEARAQELEQDLERASKEKARLFAFLCTGQKADRQFSQFLIEELELAKAKIAAQRNEALCLQLQAESRSQELERQLAGAKRDKAQLMAFLRSHKALAGRSAQAMAAAEARQAAAEALQRENQRLAAGQAAARAVADDLLVRAAGRGRGREAAAQAARAEGAERALAAQAARAEEAERALAAQVQRAEAAERDNAFLMAQAREHDSRLDRYRQQLRRAQGRQSQALAEDAAAPHLLGAQPGASAAAGKPSARPAGAVLWLGCAVAGLGLGLGLGLANWLGL
ncbi:hypothetical protein HYH03_016849 [Edaphochlamys debaryana]|nr:hypothetical protein HYH03_016849 [Edaphochlamys debaryana]|eukprot:KAG2484305.1 hypothetical protein HYH03_016849 [Edaphochlamys debaryana]